jgi:rhamnosyltransferase
MRFSISCVVVLFNPKDEVVRTIESLAAAGLGVVVVVNSASDALLREIAAIHSASIINNHENIGLATALNLGIRHAFEVNGSDFVALFDQDSSPSVSMVADLTRELQTSTLEKVACIGPMLVDKKKQSAAYRSNNRQVSRARPRSIPTSGTVIPRDAFFAVGPMMDELFIDGIDHEWCFRASSKGYAVLVSGTTHMLHDMGDAGLNCFGQYKPVHRAPIRHYYIVRNALFLARLEHLPLGWRIGELLKTIRRIAVYLAVSTNRKQTLRLVGHAIRDGLASRLGPCKCL